LAATICRWHGGRQAALSIRFHATPVTAGYIIEEIP
jgi:hypothetical protein